MDDQMNERDTSQRAVRTAKLSLFVVVLALAVTVVLFFGLTRNMTGLVDALHEQDMQMEMLRHRIQSLEQAAGVDAASQ